MKFEQSVTYRQMDRVKPRRGKSSDRKVKQRNYNTIKLSKTEQYAFAINVLSNYGSNTKEM